ncbi:hypothetical protein SynA1560_01092 [Synechococcus sp. A15-60]|nr:hypothetical protein SynA1560_01092 [Synechococcus sp. A15-60]
MAYQMSLAKSQFRDQQTPQTSELPQRLQASIRLNLNEPTQ